MEHLLGKDDGSSQDLLRDDGSDFEEGPMPFETDEAFENVDSQYQFFPDDTKMDFNSQPGLDLSPSASQDAFESRLSFFSTITLKEEPKLDPMCLYSSYSPYSSVPFAGSFAKAANDAAEETLVEEAEIPRKSEERVRRRKLTDADLEELAQEMLDYLNCFGWQLSRESVKLSPKDQKLSPEDQRVTPEEQTSLIELCIHEFAGKGPEGLLDVDVARALCKLFGKELSNMKSKVSTTLRPKGQKTQRVDDGHQLDKRHSKKQKVAAS